MIPLLIAVILWECRYEPDKPISVTEFPDVPILKTNLIKMSRAGQAQSRYSGITRRRRGWFRQVRAGRMKMARVLKNCWLHTFLLCPAFDGNIPHFLLKIWHRWSVTTIVSNTNYIYLICPWYTHGSKHIGSMYNVKRNRYLMDFIYLFCLSLYTILDRYTY